MIVGLASLAGPLLVIARIVIFRVSGKGFRGQCNVNSSMFTGGMKDEEVIRISRFAGRHCRADK